MFRTTAYDNTDEWLAKYTTVTGDRNPLPTVKCEWEMGRHGVQANGLSPRAHDLLALSGFYIKHMFYMALMSYFR